MTLAVVQDEMERFLASTTPEVLCISGGWGIGKTFAWRRVVGLAVRANKVGLKSYSYTSLFGVGSLSDLQKKIFDTLVDVAKAEQSDLVKADLEYGKAQVKALARRLSPLLKEVPKFNRAANIILPMLPALLTRDCIVVLDDIERRDPSLTLIEIFGLANELRERAGCKCVLIINQDAFSEADTEVFPLLQDKSVDTTIVFAPTSSESLSIAIAGTDLGAEVIKERLEALDVANIRVIKRIEGLWNKIRGDVEGLHEDVVRQIANTLALFGAAKFKVAGCPPLSILKEATRVEHAGYGSAGRKTFDEAWPGFLEKHSHRHTDELDLAVISGVENGYFPSGRLLALAKEMQKRFQGTARGGKLNAAWKLYHSSLSPNGDEIVAGFLDAFSSEADLLSMENANATVQMLRRMGRPDEAARAIGLFIDGHSDRRTDYEIDRGFFSDAVDDDFGQALALKVRSFADERPFLALAEKVEVGWDQADSDRMNSFTKAEVYEAIKGFKGDSLPGLLTVLIRFANHAVTAQTFRQVLKEVIDELASESPLNEMRLARFRLVDRQGG